MKKLLFLFMLYAVALFGQGDKFPPNTFWQASENDIYRLNGNVGIGTTAPGAKLDVAGLIRNSQTLTALNAHAYEDLSILNIDAEDLSNGYSSYDVYPTMNNTANVGHFNGYQSRLQYAGSGTVTNVTDYSATLTHSGSGIITSHYGTYIHAPVISGGGSITNNYGLMIGQISAGTGTNYSIYTEGGGANKIHLGAYLLEVIYAGDSNVNIANFLNSGQTTAGRQTYMFFGKSLAAGGAASIGFSQDTGTPANSYAYFGTPYGQSEATKSLVVANSGNVGIGTISPLHRQTTVSSIATNLNAFNFVDSDINLIRTTVAQTIDTSSFNLAYSTLGSPTLTLKGKTGVNLFSVDSANTKVLSLIATDSILVGTTKLSVPDYVFEESYKQNSIEEMRDFYLINKHLPTMPSAKEVNANPINIMSYSLKLLETIEVQAKYISELNKKIKSYNRRLSALEKK